MNQIVRYEFLGNVWLFALLMLTGFGIPFAIVYLLNTTIAIHQQVDDPEAFVTAYRSKRA